MSTAYHSLFSQALTSSALMSSVSPQTGMFQANLKLADIKIGIEQPAQFALILTLGASAEVKASNFSEILKKNSIQQPNINPSCASFNTSFIDLAANKWFTSDGAVETINVVGGADRSILLLYHKINDTIISPISSGPGQTKGWEVKYKNGMREYYQEDGFNDFRYALLVQQVSPAGHILTFSYDNFKRLIKIQDGSNNKNNITIDYGDQENPGNGREYTVTQSTYGQEFKTKIKVIKVPFTKTIKTKPVKLDFYVISLVSLPNEDLLSHKSYRFSYQYAEPEGAVYSRAEEMKKVLLEAITPYGLTQKVTYTSLNYGDITYDDDDGIVRFLAKIPVVKSLYITDIGNGELGRDAVPYIISYQFRGEDNANNFTGYTTGELAAFGIDGCIIKSNDYTYSTIEVHGSSDIANGVNSGVFDKKIIRTYDRFHRLTQEKSIYRDAGSLAQVLVNYSYPTNSGDISAQENNFQYWTECRTEYIMDEPSHALDESHVKIQTRSVDSYGNTLSITEESGITTNYVYYSMTDDEENGCPMPLNGLPCYVKSIETIPNPSSLQPLPANKREEFTYKKVDGIQYTCPLSEITTTPYMVLPAKSKIRVAGIMQTLSDCNYKQGEQSGILIGALTSIDTISQNVPQGGKDVKIINTTDFTWELINAESDATMPVCVKKITKNTASIDDVLVTKIIEGGNVTTRLADDLVVTETSSSGVETKYEYNRYGRLEKKISFANKPLYTETEEYSFEFPLDYQYFRIKNLVTYKKLRTIDSNDASIYLRFYLGGDFQVCGISQGIFEAGSQLGQLIDPNAEGFLIAKSNIYSGNGNLLSESLKDGGKNSMREWVKIDISSRFVNLSNSGVTTDATGANWIELLNQRDNLSFNSVSGGDICYLNKLNNYGSIDEIKLGEFGLDHIEDDPSGLLLLSNKYDGFGRLLSTGKSTLGYTNYQYDELDRVLQETAGMLSGDGFIATMQDSTYQYSKHIPSMELPVRLICTSRYPGNKTIMDSQREYDVFSRLTQQITPMEVLSPLPPQTVLTENYEYNDDIFPYLPTKVTKSVGNISYSYDSATGLLLNKRISNGSGSTQAPDLTVAFDYNKQTKLLHQTSVSVTSNGSKQCQYDYSYDRFDRMTLMKVFYNDVEKYRMSFDYTKLLGLPTQWMLKDKDDNNYLRCDFFYNSAGRVSEITYAPFDIGNIGIGVISIVATYVDCTGGYGCGNVQSITLAIEDFDLPDDVTNAINKMAILFEYDECGREIKRSYSITNDDDDASDDIVFYVENKFDIDSKLVSRTVGKRDLPSTSSHSGIDNGDDVSADDGYSVDSFEFRYKNYGGGMLDVSIVSGDANGAGRTTYFAEGVVNFDRIVRVPTGSELYEDRYNYKADCVRGITPPSGQASKVYEYDKNGNVSKDPDLNLLRYNADNALSTLIKSNNEDRYYYSATGELNRVLRGDGKDTFYFYTDSTLAGELNADLRAFYIRAGEILLGRILVYSGNRVDFELYGTDSMGSVRAACKFTAGASAATTEYYDYSDYGAVI
ncbi:hypothetical protein [Shewanella sp. S23-S33]|uniref:hypothetical protein n=1 Tax=Shewanella sp. S23-S33 TaxID=3342769 RepID=UPI00372D6A10